MRSFLSTSLEFVELVNQDSKVNSVSNSNVSTIFCNTGCVTISANMIASILLVLFIYFSTLYVMPLPLVQAGLRTRLITTRIIAFWAGTQSIEQTSKS